MLHSPILEKPRHERRFETSSTERGGAAGRIRNEATKAGETLLAIQHAQEGEADLNSRLAACLRELSLVAMYFPTRFRERLTKQLKNLFCSEDWEDQEDQLPSVQSFRSLIRAMVLLEPEDRPMLGLSPKGHLLAMWASDARHLSFEFLAGDEVKWFVNSETEDGRDSGAGTTTVGRICRIIEAHEMSGLLYGQG